MSVGVLTVTTSARSWRPNLWRGYVAIAVTAAALLVAFPDVDLWLAHMTYTPGAGFVGWHYGWLSVARYGFIAFYFTSLAAAILCWLMTRRGERRLFDRKQWRFIFVCLVVGPGLLANVGFKDQWGRARPKHIIVFGGSKQFTPALLPSNQCERNCSFVSGEASSVFAPFFAAAAIAPQWAATLLLAGTTAGLAAGALRMLHGAHFLSDIVFAGLFMALMVLALQPLLFGTVGSWLRPRWQRLQATSELALVCLRSEKVRRGRMPAASAFARRHTPFRPP